MTAIADQKYLLTKQYCNGSKLNARIQLHTRFSQNKYNFHRWIFDHLKLEPESAILELGCGTGQLWTNNLDRLNPSWHITLSDFSVGMLQETQQNLQGKERLFTFRIIDAQSIPFADQSLDVVIANHMLYHVPNRARALHEICRVLKPNGTLYAATSGKGYLLEIRQLLQLVGATDTDLFGNESGDGFTLESGYKELAHYFHEVTGDGYRDQLVVTETEPLLNYILSGATGETLTPEQKTKLQQIIAKEIAQKGALRIQKPTGLLIAHSPKR
ncbi:class I SAM-dependent methyltransferase [Thermosporothrix hazakensis]|nr:class I SAM-dependent methyltransferase [Thermosporothrix hazakensis]BBH90944.1 hypothetical protein KTC_56950 [Thermosporothrix sp. COM3]GCE48994.1 hypothetical protein KTH_38630 [Thermosporothrix hazakensis]